ncbi:serine/threonine-protein kinase [Actinoplanes sp. NPDC049802]|uniref:serine/threonine-protein kinase n=1 Tax=Actinoplanes sp. NPDC049802 TaxID=3154742 RepID=UPI0033F943B7
MATVGEVVAGRYRLVRPLASGGMSRVWLAADESGGRVGATYGPSGEHVTERRPEMVVVKHCVVPAGLPAGQHELLRRLALPEAEAAARVRHPNVIRVLDVIASWDGPWLVMEYLPSRSLHQVIQESGPLPPARVAAIGLAVLAGLRAARQAGVLHLDVKPGNVLIGTDGRVVLTDFGPAVTPDGVRRLTDAGIILGSPKYIAPERVFDHVSDERSDLWSLGATLYHAVEGRPPFQRDTTTEILRAVGGDRPAPARRAGPLAPVLSALLHREPSRRMPASEVAARLDRILVAEAGRRRPRSRFRRRVPAIAAAVALAATLTAVAANAQGGERSGTPYAVTTSPPAVASSTPPAPEGFTWWIDPSGFQIAVPATWRQAAPATGGLTFTGGKRGRSVLGITPLPRPPSDVVAPLEDAERAADLDDYRRLRLQPLPEPFSAVWEYTFRGPDGTAMRALRRITSSGNRSYMIEWRTPRSVWASELSRFTVVLASFAPQR